MTELIFYNSYDIFKNEKNKHLLKNIPGGQAFSSYFEIFSPNITAVDRTGTITLPLKTKVLDHLKMPEYQKFDTSFEEICDDRAKFLLQFSESKNKKIAVMYSGGIDSTLILCSFLKVATENQLKNVIVLLSDESVLENQQFYNNFILKKFNCISSYRFPYFLGNDNYLLLSGENADQLFGSQVNDSYSRNNPYSHLFNTMDSMENQMIDFFRLSLSDENKKYAEPILNLFKKMVDNAPIKLENVYQFFWWINFTTKWQSVYVRLLAYTLNKTSLKLEENYTTFYHTEPFQLWALNNTDKFSLDIDNCGKIVSKKYIFDVNGDKDYMKKPKLGSLAHLAKRKEMVYTIDSNVQFGDEYPTEEYYNYGNDFEKMMHDV